MGQRLMILRSTLRRRGRGRSSRAVPHDEDSHDAAAAGAVGKPPGLAARAVGRAQGLVVDELGSLPVSREDLFSRPVSRRYS